MIDNEDVKELKAAISAIACTCIGFIVTVWLCLLAVGICILGVGLVGYALSLLG